jgi:hypothetical protein
MGDFPGLALRVLVGTMVVRALAGARFSRTQ